MRFCLGQAKGKGKPEAEAEARRDAPGVKALIKRMRILRASACSRPSERLLVRT